MDQSLRNPPPPSWGQTIWAKGAFIACLVWLAYLAILLNFHSHESDTPLFWGALLGLVLLTPLFWGEAIYAWVTKAPNRRALLASALLPPLRLGIRDGAANHFLWFPQLGWRPVTPQLEKEITQKLNTPMLIGALLVLPLIIVEVLLKERIDSDPRLHVAVGLSTALVWWMFTIEFIVMVSVTPKPLLYVKQHLLDLIIILLPLVMFLRVLRLGQLLRLTSLTNASRMYKLRGVGMRMYRALLLVGVVRNLLQGSPQTRLNRLKQRLADHEAQGEALRAEIAELEVELALAAPEQLVA